ncbi:MAG: MBL fold metallo-hydrolase [Clostridia bacterium]|nr:MBL fold metallo-hydrolase [Clostridia bacterium]
MDNDWFTVERIDENTFAISEYKHREEMHSYLLIGMEKALLIDTGLGVANIKSVIDALTKLPIIVATTHIHWDHIGGHKYFDNIAVYECEKQWFTDFPLPLEVVKANLQDTNCNFPKNFDINNYTIFQANPQFLLHENEIINLGGRRILIIHTPGHSPGHCCFYELDKGYLFSGDLIYKGCLDIYYPTTDINDFENSINKIKQLSISRILPAHHSLNISVGIIDCISNAFKSLRVSGKLRQGNGIFDFAAFKIHI